MHPLLSLALWALALHTAAPLPTFRDIRGLPLDPGVPPTPAAERAVDEVVIGLISNRQGDEAPLAEAVLAGARLAVAQVERGGGVAGRTIRLAVRSTAGPWSQAGRRVVELAHGERVWAVIAGPDRDTAHLALQICTKSHTPVLLPLTTDDSLVYGGVPWVFRLARGPDDIPPSPPAAPATAAFRRAWRAANEGEPPVAAALGWDAVQLVVAGLREVGLDRPGLRSWLSQRSGWPGASGPITFCPNGDRKTAARCPGT